MKYLVRNSAIFILICFIISCNCLNADCPENAVDISVDFRELGSSQIKSLEGIKISVKSEDNVSISYNRILVFLTSKEYKERGISFLAYSGVKYNIYFDNELISDIEILTQIESEDECCESYSILDAKFNGIEFNCNDECMRFGFLTITI